jgi:uncharacterized protein HemX
VGPPSEMPPMPSTGSQDENSAGESAESPEAQGRTEAFGRRSALLVVVALALFLAGFLTVQQVRKARSAKRALLIRSLAVLPLENLSGDPAREESCLANHFPDFRDAIQESAPAAA